MNSQCSGEGSKPQSRFDLVAHHAGDAVAKRVVGDVQEGGVSLLVAQVF